MNMSRIIYDEKWGDIATEVLNKMIKHDCFNLKQLKVDVKHSANFPNQKYVRLFALMNKAFDKKDSDCVDDVLIEAANYLKLVASIFEEVYIVKSIITVEEYNKMRSDEKKLQESFKKDLIVLKELKTFVSEEVVDILKDFNNNEYNDMLSDRLLDIS
jgi:hypothetical protein